MAKWNILLGRITLFPAADAVASLPAPDEIYHCIWGARPDSYQKSMNAMAPSIAQGKIGHINASCLVHPTRVDINLMPTPTPDSGFQTIEDTREARAELARIIHELGKGILRTDMTRIALFMHSVQLVATIATANELLLTIIPNRYGLQISNDEEDFILQTNRPYRSERVSGVVMNSLTKWSSERFQVITVAIPVGAVPATPGAGLQPDNREFITASTSFDINSRPGQVRLTAAQQGQLLNEALERVTESQRTFGLNMEGW